MVLELNPDDELVLQRLERLRAGKTVSELPEPLPETGSEVIDVEAEEV